MGTLLTIVPDDNVKILNR